MSIKILGGEFKGASLKVLDSQHLRPTSVLLRRKIFDWQQDWDEKIFIDLCAGTGAMGLEALSRGAKEVWMVEKERKHVRFLEENIELINKRSTSLLPIRLVCEDSLSFLKKHQDLLSLPTCVLYFDPPYEEISLYESVISWLGTFPDLKASIWIESDDFKGISLDRLTLKFAQPFKIIRHSSHFVVAGHIL